MLAQGEGDVIELDRTLNASFAGLDFELSGEPTACALLANAPGVIRSRPGLRDAGAGSFADAPKFAERCALELVPAPAGSADAAGSAPIAWRWQGEHGEVLTRGSRAEVWHGGGGFRGRAWIAAPRGASPLLAGLAALLLHRTGGTILHAASVELDGGVVAFIGPSGAGKSTACRHVVGAEMFSVDRLAISRGTVHGSASRTTWLSHPLSGGTPVPDIPLASPRALPLRGVLRVHRSTSGDTSIEPTSRANAVAALRESTFQAGAGAAAEFALLETLDRLAGDIPVARLHLALGATLRSPLRRWLVDPGTREG